MMTYDEIMYLSFGFEVSLPIANGNKPDNTQSLVKRTHNHVKSRLTPAGTGGCTPLNFSEMAAEALGGSR